MRDIVSPLDGFRSPFGARRGAAIFSPAVLFAAGEQGVWYDPSDMTTLFQDAAGTTPVTAVEQPVGLMLDKSKGLVIGPELLSNSGNPFTVTTGWTGASGATLSVVSGKLRFTGNGSTTFPRAYTSISTVVGTLYKITANGTYVSGSDGVFYTKKSDATASDVNAVYSATTASGTIESYFIATATTTYVFFQANSANSVVEVSSFSTKSIAGNHATQATPSARPVLSARVNLLTKTEEFNDAVWVKANATSTSPVVTANQGVAPDGTTTADKVDFGVIDAAADYSTIAQNFSFSTIPYNQSVYVKAWAAGDVGKKIWIYFYDTNVRGLASITLTTDWQRLSTSVTPISGGSVSIATLGSTYGGENQGAVSVLLWGADLRVANDTALPVYQRVNVGTPGSSTTPGTADYDTVGFPMYLRFDGSDDRLSLSGTGLDILKNVNAAVIFSGVRYTGATSGYQTIFEADTNTAVDRSALYIKSTTAFEAGGRRLDADSYQGLEVTSVGMTQQNVLTANFDYANAQLYARRNGVQYQRGGGFQTAGNTSNTASNAITIASTGAGGQWFNGRLYSLIVRGAATSDTLIGQTENWISGEMGGGYYPTGFDFLVDANGDQLTDASGNPIITQAYY